MGCPSPSRNRGGPQAQSHALGGTAAPVGLRRQWEPGGKALEAERFSHMRGSTHGWIFSHKSADPQEFSTLSFYRCIPGVET